MLISILIFVLPSSDHTAKIKLRTVCVNENHSSKVLKASVRHMII